MEELDKKIDNLLEIIDNDERIIKLLDVKNKLFSNKEFIAKINKLKELDTYSNRYKELKKELFQNSDFIIFKELENEVNFLILEINNRLRTLTNERRCNHEGN